MTDSMPKNGPYEPATDEQIEFWQVQVDYGAKIVVGPIARDMLGAILARLVASERERDEAVKLRREALGSAAEYERGALDDANDAALARRERDEARKAHCTAQHEAEQIGYDERGTSWQNGPRTPREIAAEEYGEVVAARLFLPEAKP